VATTASQKNHGSWSFEQGTVIQKYLTVAAGDSLFSGFKTMLK
jgi:hypothetical protein